MCLEYGSDCHHQRISFKSKKINISDTDTNLMTSSDPFEVLKFVSVSSLPYFQKDRCEIQTRSQILL